MGFLQLTRYGDDYINAVVGYSYNGLAYPGSCADNPEINFPKPVGHFSTWNIIETLRKEGVTHYETGWQQFTAQPYDSPSEKDISISYFKSKFGGYNAPLFRGVLRIG